jgi:hypothetical protein
MFRILHLPTGTYICQSDVRGEFYTEAEKLEYESGEQYKQENSIYFPPEGSYFDKEDFESLLKRIKGNPTYLTNFRSVPEHFILEEVEDV